jgi:hypothetical protein
MRTAVEGLTMELRRTRFDSFLTMTMMKHMYLAAESLAVRDAESGERSTGVTV